MGRDAQGRRVMGGRLLWGRWSAFGLGVAAVACLIDQASKVWLLQAYGL